MSDITVIGLGLMGAALAWAIQRAGHNLTVWNRSPDKMQPFVDEGAVGAPAVISAITASPVILVCVDNYAVTKSLLQSTEGIPLVADRTVIQLSTGAPRDALEAEAWINDCGGSYIDGAILGGPERIGTADGQILFAGSKSVYTKVEPLVRCLAGNGRYVGENIRAAAVLDLAWLCQRYGLFLGLTQGALLCEAEEVSVELYASMFPEGSRSHDFAKVIHDDAFEGPSATLNVWKKALQPIQQHALETGINDEILEFVSGFLKRAIAAGHGEEDVAALIKVLRDNKGA